MFGLGVFFLAIQLNSDIIVLRLYSPSRDSVPLTNTTIIINAPVPKVSTTNLQKFSTTTEKEFHETTTAPTTSTEKSPTKAPPTPCVNVGTQQCFSNQIIGAGLDDKFLSSNFTPGR